MSTHNNIAERKNVVVLGAGYAGSMAANRILAAGRPDITVTVLNPRPQFVERVRLHQVATGTSDGIHALTEVLDPDAEIRVGVAERIGEHDVMLEDGTTLPFDLLLYAVGSTRDMSRVAGGTHTFGVDGYEESLWLGNALESLDDGTRVTVVGGGLTGIEVGAEIAERYPALRVSLVSGAEPAAGLPLSSREGILRRLRALDVQIRSGVTVSRVTATFIEFDDGSVVSSECTVWAGGFTAPDLAARSGLPVDAHGRLLADASLICTDRPDIVGIGDAVAPPREVAAHIRMSCQAAIPLGAHGADTVLALLDGASPRPLSLGFVAQCISVGRRYGVVQSTRRDDTPRSPAAPSTPRTRSRRAICASRTSTPTPSTTPAPTSRRW
ncbi:NAD(P)/FAD-dependent oxidoreductase [Rhodococcus marinonascens]|uniref:NAD(P)/FAD-dependent oxidoreductase n=1 Tax=Rhodococcus marinonascens TaxID=38311 RepID=UPI0009353EDA|nr:FAD-dependent oxidoreductase [Rhodococcus marinonascens]